MRGNGGIPTEDMEILNVAANTHQGCTYFDLDAEISGVGFRERLMACARSGGQDDGSLKSPPDCTDFSLDAEILGRRVPRAIASGSGSLKRLPQGAVGRFTFLARLGARVGHFEFGPSRSQFRFVEGRRHPPGCTDFSLDAGILGCRVSRATAGGSGSLTYFACDHRANRY
jgi:hypothetical protein